jgi:hypothetical protein
MSGGDLDWDRKGKGSTVLSLLGFLVKWTLILAAIGMAVALLVFGFLFATCLLGNR